jgi:4-alpha-glucanotransferase
MKFNRRGGILLHPTSLPGPYGIGDLGSQAHQFIDILAETGCGLWQVLPLGPTGYGNSPYQSFSSFAGNPYLISPDALRVFGLLRKEDIEDRPSLPGGRVDYGVVIPWKMRLLEIAYNRFIESPAKLRDEFTEFLEAQLSWLPDFGLFMALKDQHGGGPWVDWPEPLRKRDAKALADAQRAFSNQIQKHMFGQFIFYKQWENLRQHANEKNIQLIGDIPIFVAHDSAEVWSHPELFYLDESGQPLFVAGVPPDYFSETGQLWGNPIYRWDMHAETGYAWWMDRIKSVLHLVDIARVDHFRGFAAYWEVPGNAKTAENGRWVDAPGEDFFQAVQDTFGELPFIAEDLGVITPDVIELREKFNLPGMIVLQFAFHGDPAENFLPHNHVQNRVVYTGTHDNDTIMGWFERVSEEEHRFIRRYLGIDGREISWDLIRAAWQSVAIFALAPMQDFLRLGTEARMNFPGKPRNNWEWRMESETLVDWTLKTRIREMNFLYARSTHIESEKRTASPYSPGSTV